MARRIMVEQERQDVMAVVTPMIARAGGDFRTRIADISPSPGGKEGRRAGQPEQRGTGFAVRAVRGAGGGGDQTEEERPNGLGGLGCSHADEGEEEEAEEANAGRRARRRRESGSLANNSGLAIARDHPAITAAGSQRQGCASAALSPRIDPNSALAPEGRRCRRLTRC